MVWCVKRKPAEASMPDKAGPFHASVCCKKRTVFGTQGRDSSFNEVLVPFPVSRRYGSRRAERASR